MAKYETYTQRELVNPDTGEITVIDTAKTFTAKITEDKFYMTFIDFIGPIFGLKPDSAKVLLIWMCEHAEFNTGKVDLTTATRKQISTETGLSNNSITNYLKKLKELNIISGEKGSYILNPQIFWKGDLATRREFLKDKQVRVTFSIEEPSSTKK